MAAPSLQEAPSRFSAHEDVVAPGTSLIRVDGELDLATAAQLRDVVHAALRREPDSIIVDLGGCTFLDSAGLKVLVSLAAGLEDSRRLAVAGACTQTKRLVSVTGFDRQIAFVDSVDEALVATTAAAA